MLRLSNSIGAILVAAGTLALTGSASAQIQPVAFESFDIPGGLPLGGQGTGTGWTNFWWSGNLQDDAVTTAPGYDPIGSKVTVNNENAGSYRILDIMPHPELDDGTGLFGADDSTMWFTYTTQDEQAVSGTTYFGGFSLFIQLQGEYLFIGSPWMTELWGIDDKNGNVYTVPGSNDDALTTIVTRVDWFAGDERVRMWLDPLVPHPLANPDVDVMVPDFRFNEVGFNSGGQTMPVKYSFDNIIIEKGEPGGGPIGTNYCGPAIPNSTGQPGVISASGSVQVAANDVMLTASGMPAGQFGYFLAGQTQGFFNPPGSSGIICLSGNIGRYNQAANIIQGPMGSITLDLGAIPVNPPAAVMSGDTWFFQCWYRDVGTSNFTDGIQVDFL